jgi:hypothetical protein
MPLSSLGIVVGGPDKSGRSNFREVGRSWAIRQILKIEERS